MIFSFSSCSSASVPVSRRIITPKWQKTDRTAADKNPTAERQVLVKQFPPRQLCLPGLFLHILKPYDMIKQTDKLKVHTHLTETLHIGLSFIFVPLVQ